MLVQELKTMCNAMRNDVRVAPPVQTIVAHWAAQVAQFKEQIDAPGADAAALAHEIRLGYESAIAIASKQRQFDLASALFAQMQTLAFVPTDATFAYVIRNVALELVSRPTATSIETLRTLVGDRSTWERDLLEIIRSEEYAHHRKTPLERARFHQELLAGVETHLDTYEARVAASERSPVPYNKALRVYAENGVSFVRMLKLMVSRSVTPDVETYVSLLQGARWTEIPATLSQLLASGLVERLTKPSDNASVTLQQSHDVHTIWSSAMKAVVHSYKDRFFDRKASVSHADVQELKKICQYVDKQLARAFPQFRFATPAHHNDVYALRAKAAATTGLEQHVLRVLDEYVALAPTGEDGNAVLLKDAFLCALELYPSSQLEIMHLPRDVVQARALHRDVAKSRRVSELERLHARLADKVLPAAIAKLDKVSQDDRADVRVVAELKAHVATTTRTEQAMARRLNNARILKSYQLLIQETFERADAAVDAIERKLAKALAIEDVASDMDVALKRMEQYMTCANRFEQRLRSRQKELAPQLMRRVFRVIKRATSALDESVLDDPRVREQVNELFHLAIRTTVLCWRYDDAETLVRKKKQLLQAPLLDVREYELLIFREVTQRNVRGAYALVHELHNAGVAPPKEAIHRIVLGVLHQLHKYPDAGVTSDQDDDVASNTSDDALPTDTVGSPSDTNALDADETAMLESSDTQTIEDELAFHDELQFDDVADESDAAAKLVLGSGAPSSIVDIPGFLQDWYNLHGIRPAAKTVVPVFARLLASRDLPEIKRLLQILESMDGGLTPATELWLEMRLARLGKTLDDVRVR